MKSKDSIRISGKNINFNDKKINESNFYKSKKLFKIDDIDDNKILVSKKKTYDEKNSFRYFIGYDHDTIKPLCIRLTEMIGYAKYFENNNRKMSFKDVDKRLLKSIIKYGKKLAA